MDPIRRLEEASDRAWPAREVERGDDWVARFADGMHRRLNSATVWAASDLEAVLDGIAAWYSGHGLPPLYKLTGSSHPGLDAALAARGYAADPGVLVMSRPLGPGNADIRGVEISEAATEAWRDAFARISGYGPRRRHLVGEVLDRISLPAAAARVEESGDIVAVGMAVADGEHAGLFEIAVDPGHRRRGHAGRVVDALLDWSARRGAGTAYLQVFAGNLPALALYRNAGFSLHHRYWYREPPGGLPPGPR